MASELKPFIAVSAKVLIVIYYHICLHFSYCHGFFVIDIQMQLFYNKSPNYDHNVHLILICYDKKLMTMMPVKNVKIYGITAYDKYIRK